MGDCFQGYMEESAVETLLLSAQFLQCVCVKGSELFPDLRGAKLLEYNSEMRRKSLIQLCRQLSQALLAEVFEEVGAKTAAERDPGGQQSGQIRSDKQMEETASVEEKEKRRLRSCC